VTDAAEGKVSTFYFAKDLPGAPVLFYTDVPSAAGNAAGAAASRVVTSTLVEYAPGH
jgi:hypothetical protein